MKTIKQNKILVTALSTVIGLATLTSTTVNASENESIKFRMVPSLAAKNCLRWAKGHVTVHSTGPVEDMHVELKGLPPKTEFDLFVIQVPNAPFGLSWYQGDIETDSHGKAVGDFVGRFNEETFIVAPGTDVAPQVHDDAFPDADSNSETGPIHTFHVGLWFNSPEDAAKAGCADTVTPFNGEHNAGIQVLTTRQFRKEKGPLAFLKP